MKLDFPCILLHIVYIIYFVEHRPSSLFYSNKPNLAHNNLWREAKLHVRLPRGYEDPKSYFFQYRNDGDDEVFSNEYDLMTSSTNRIGAVDVPVKSRKNIYETIDFDEKLDDIILENVLMQILNSSYHRRRKQFRPHQQYPQVHKHVLNGVKIPPQFPHYKYRESFHPSKYIKQETLQSNEFKINSDISKVGYGNGIELNDPNAFLYNTVFNPTKLNNLKLRKGALQNKEDYLQTYVRRQLAGIQPNQATDPVYNSDRYNVRFKKPYSNGMSDIYPPPTSHFSGIYSLQDVITKDSNWYPSHTTNIHKNNGIEWNTEFAKNKGYTPQTGTKKQWLYPPTDLDDEIRDTEGLDIPIRESLPSIEELEVESTVPESSLLNRLTANGLKFALKHVNNLIFDGKRQDEKLAETISTAIIHDIPNLLIPELPKLPQIFSNPFAASKEESNEDNNTRPSDLKTSASINSPTSTLPSPLIEDKNLRYLFLLGVVPTVVGSFLAIGAQPLQAMLVGAYIVTTYLFFVENNWRGERTERTVLSLEDSQSRIEDIDQVFFEAINKFLNVTKKLRIEKKNVDDSKEIVDQLPAQDISDLMINKYFNHSEQLKPLLNLMDDQTISYLNKFDEIISDVLASIHK